MRLTEQVHRRLSERLLPGDAALDATAGSGHDTLFLARTLHPGPVHAVDIQPAALVRTRRRLEAAGAGDNVNLHRGSHAQPACFLPEALYGRLAVVMFNLGYLPGEPEGATTGPASTLAALEAMLAWLAPGGALSVVAYRGHAGGGAEATAVAEWFGRRMPSAEIHDTGANGPVWWLGCRQGPGGAVGGHSISGS